MNREYRDNEIDFTNKLTEITKEGGWSNAQNCTFKTGNSDITET